MVQFNQFREKKQYSSTLSSGDSSDENENIMFKKRKNSKMKPIQMFRSSHNERNRFDRQRPHKTVAELIALNNEKNFRMSGNNLNLDKSYDSLGDVGYVTLHDNEINTSIRFSNLFILHSLNMPSKAFLIFVLLRSIPYRILPS